MKENRDQNNEKLYVKSELKEKIPKERTFCPYQDEKHIPGSKLKNKSELESASVAVTV